MKQLSAFIFTFLFIWNANAQTIANSTRKVISSKAAKGELMEYYVNEETKQIELVYKIKENKKKIILETYFFKQSDLSFIESKEEEIEKEKVRWRKKRMKKGEKVTLLKVMPNLFTGQIKLAKGYLSYAYAGRAMISEFHETMKVKPKGTDGDRLVYLHHRTEQPGLTGYGTAKGFITMGVGNVMLLAIENAQPFYENITALLYDAHTLDRKFKNKIELGYSYMPLSVRDLPNGNMAVLLRSMSMKDIPKPEHSKKIMAKFKLAPNYHLRYLEINTKCEVVHSKEIAVPEPETGYYINASISSSEDAQQVTIMALVNPFSIKGPPIGKVFPMAGIVQNRTIDLHKPDKAWIITLVNGKLQYTNEVEVPNLLGNAQNPKGGKSYVPETDEKSVKKYFAHGSNVVPVSVIVQNGKTIVYVLKGNNITQLLQLGEKGNIEKNYYITCDKKQIIGEDMKYHVNSKGELFVFAFQHPIPKSSTQTDLEKAKEDLTGTIMKVDVPNKTIGTPLGLTPDSNLDIYDGMYLENIDSWLTLGRGKKKEIVLSRITL